jgi:tetratricopeptide (TPR) repeat protein
MGRPSRLAEPAAPRRTGDPIPHALSEERIMLKRFLSSFRSPDPRRAEIAELEERLRTAPRDSRAKLYNRLGDLYLHIGDQKKAIAYFGEGIDAYLESGHFDPAAALCRKLIGSEPRVIRARCTLAFLSLGKGFVEEAEREIDDYVRAAVQTGKTAYAVSRLRMMAEATYHEGIRELLAAHLEQLGDDEGARQVRASIERLKAGDGLSAGEQREKWGHMLRQAITDPPV